jgi:PmbA protein
MKTDSEFSSQLLVLAMKKGAPMAEVYQKASWMLSAEAKASEADAVETARSFGYCLRVIDRNRLGFSYSTDKNEMDRVIETAIEMSKHTEMDEFLSLPEPLEPKAPEVYDSSIEALREEDVIEKAILVEQAALEEDSRVKRVRKASASFHVSDVHVMNSKGISYGYRATSCTAHVMSVAEEGEDSQMGWGYQGSRFLSDISFEGVGTSSARRALALLGARRISATKSAVLLDNTVAAEFLSVFASMLSSEAVQKGKSLLGGRAGQKVASGILDMVDDGLMPHASGSRHIDDEGVPIEKKYLIKEGVLQGYMYNTHTAGKDNVKSTGNAVRAGLQSPPSVGPINLYADSSENKVGLKEMMSSIEHGLYVTEAMGVHTANPVSGDFSIGVSGLWIESGKAEYPVKEAVLSGNMLEFFNTIDVVGDDLNFFGSIGSPSILFGPNDISA